MGRCVGWSSYGGGRWILAVNGGALIEVWYVGVSCFVCRGGREASKTRVLYLVLVWGVEYGGWLGLIATRIVVGCVIVVVVVVVVLGRVRGRVLGVLIIVVIIIIINWTVRVGAVTVVAVTICLVYFLCFACHVFDVFTFSIVFFLSFVIGLTELLFYIFLQRFQGGGVR